jgi:hypothetical protein
MEVDKNVTALGLRLRQHSQFLTLVFSQKHFNKEELMKTKGISINAQLYFEKIIGL